MKNEQLIGYGILAVIAAVILYHIWQWIIGGLAIFGVIYVLSQVNKQPPSR
jgi:hypothetical protein